MNHQIIPHLTPARLVGQKFGPHPFGDAKEVGIRSTECGVISDVAMGSGEGWQSALGVMLSAENQAALDPLALAGKIVEFYVEVLLPEIR